jgi:LysM repeat protein
MVDRSPARRSPARYLVPLALAAIVLSIYLVVEHALNSGTSTGPSAQLSGSRGHSAPHHSHHVTPRGPAVYVVRSGDTLGAIANRFGLSEVQIELLNPRLNPNLLQVGQRVRLKR